ncbi:MAG: hypothetical protein LBS83_01610 [Holosporales bacterium]|jgi:hypothetical protein|nr:hypothetical protein [Holosporales bacterium]
MAIPLITAAIGLAEFAPIIARWLSGHKAESVATQVVEIAKRVTKMENPMDAIKALGGNGLLVSDFQKEILRMEADIEISLIEDRQSARERDIEILRAGHANRRADLMVFAAAFGLVMCLFSLAFYSDVLPGEAVGIISTIAGIFGSCLKDAYSFEFGSSRGSKMKDTTVASVLERLRREE